MKKQSLTLCVALCGAISSCITDDAIEREADARHGFVTNEYFIEQESAVNELRDFLGITQTRGNDMLNNLLVSRLKLYREIRTDTEEGEKFFNNFQGYYFVTSDSLSAILSADSRIPTVIACGPSKLSIDDYYFYKDYIGDQYAQYDESSLPDNEDGLYIDDNGNLVRDIYENDSIVGIEIIQEKYDTTDVIDVPCYNRIEYQSALQIAQRDTTGTIYNVFLEEAEKIRFEEIDSSIAGALYEMLDTPEKFAFFRDDLPNTPVTSENESSRPSDIAVLYEPNWRFYYLGQRVHNKYFPKSKRKCFVFGPRMKPAYAGCCPVAILKLLLNNKTMRSFQYKDKWYDVPSKWNPSDEYKYAALRYLAIEMDCTLYQQGTFTRPSNLKEMLGQYYRYSSRRDYSKDLLLRCLSKGNPVIISSHPATYCQLNCWDAIKKSWRSISKYFNESHYYIICGYKKLNNGAEYYKLDLGNSERPDFTLGIPEKYNHTKHLFYYEM